jgi:hypothetical protein
MRSTGGIRNRRRAAVAAAVFALTAAGVPAADDAGNVRLGQSSQRFAVARAVRGASLKLADAGCQGLLDEFKDGAGQPLRATLDGLGLSAPQYLDRIFFYDGPPRLCGTSGLAITTPGSRAIFVCGSRFARMSVNDGHAEATIIHEMLHSLGLGENPPSSDYITDRVRARCAGNASAGMDAERQLRASERR